MFGASETPYDLRFQLLGIPVRIHPFFWLVAAMLGWRSENIPLVLIWVGCVFVSILVHEYGHGLTARAFGASPSILLHAFGGLCFYQADRQSPRQRLAVLLWGPGAGFLLCLAVMAVFSALFGITPAEHLAFVQYMLCRIFTFLQDVPGMLPNMGAVLGGERKLLRLDARAMADFDPNALHAPFEIYRALVYINLLWGLINLLPIWPLDGGQVTQTVLSEVNPYNGRRWTHIVSLLTAALCAIAIVINSQGQSMFNTLFFIYFAVINYQMLDAIHRAQTLGIYGEDWWKR